MANTSDMASLSKTRDFSQNNRKAIPIGTRFGRLVVLGVGRPHTVYANRKVGTKNHPSTSVVLCDCGVTKTVCNFLLKNGTTQSCGCLKRDKPPCFKHGYKYTRLYRIWNGMKNRCSRPNHKNYYEKGIRVCDEWNRSFLSFRNWAMQNGYADSLSIDRIDSNGNYSPENCRWADSRTQATNRCSSVLISAFGKTLTILGWERETGISRYKIKKAIIDNKENAESFFMKSKV